MSEYILYRSFCVFGLNIRLEKKMDWLEVIIYTTSFGIEALSFRLLSLGITGIQIEDENDFKEFLEHKTGAWDYVDEDLLERKKEKTHIKIYLTDNEYGKETLLLIKENLNQLKKEDTEGKLGTLEIKVNNVNEKDWEDNWKKYFKPFEIGKKLLIKPTWTPLEEKTDRIVFEINPGPLFGTGLHETTRLCIEEIESFVKPGDLVLDLGCGSGILSLISLLLGAGKAVAVDIEPNVLKTAYENADINGISRDKYIVLAGNILTDKKIIEYICKNKYDIITANIVSDVIIEISGLVKALLGENGVFIASGIIDSREDEVKSALKRSGFESIVSKADNGWVCLICS